MEAISIEEGNKMIAEFMDIKVKEKPHSHKTWYSIHYEVYDRINNDYAFYWPLDKLKFNSDWDWLIPVVEKIESIKDEYHGYFGVYISSNNCTIQATNFRPDKRIPDPPHYFSDWTLENKIMSTWTAVVYFIKWYTQTISNGSSNRINI